MYYLYIIYFIIILVKQLNFLSLNIKISLLNYIKNIIFMVQLDLIAYYNYTYKIGEVMSNLKKTAQSVNKKLGAMFIALHRKDTPLYAKIACGLCVYYALSPIDIIPDFIPILGSIDDIIILPFLMWLSFKMVPSEIMNECLEQSDEIWAKGDERKLRYAIPIFILWGIVSIRIIIRILKFI